MADGAPQSTGQIARRLNVPPHAVRRALDAIAPDAPRCGDQPFNQRRVVTPDVAKRLADELYQRGYLAEPPTS